MNNAAEFETNEDDVFGRIASRYDFLCDLFSFGIHRLWKRRVAQIIAGESWSHLLDVASGTGDIIARILEGKELSLDHNVIVSDVNQKMLSIAEKKLTKFKSNLHYKIIDAHDMSSVASSSVDVFSMSLGLKICNREKVIAEAFRVLKPGGRLITLEASNIPLRFAHSAYLVYMSICMPVIGWLAAKGDSSAYKYLLHGVRDFPTAERLKEEIEATGFQNVDFERLSFGIVAIHCARKPQHA